MNKIFLLIIISIALTACQRNHKIKEYSDWNQINEWSFNGKMAINDKKNNGSGRVQWNIKPHFIKAQFKTLLGFGGNWTLTETDKQAQLESSQNGVSIAENAEQLIANELGWHFPWKSLQYWVRGYKTDHPLITHKQLPTIIYDNDWEITYQKWTYTRLGLLPKKIKATKDNYSIKLIIYNWNF
jgi:outer membrane lipoprotein LolB